MGRSLGANARIERGALWCGRASRAEGGVRQAKKRAPLSRAWSVVARALRATEARGGGESQRLGALQHGLGRFAFSSYRDARGRVEASAGGAFTFQEVKVAGRRQPCTLLRPACDIRERDPSNAVHRLRVAYVRPEPHPS